MEKHGNMVLMGLQLIFNCKNCGNCCKIEESIAICREDIKRIATYLSMSYKNVMARYVRLEGDKYFIKISKPCVFYDNDKKCTIYDARPLICRAHPYMNMAPDFADDMVPAKKECPGSIETANAYALIMNKLGEMYQKNPENKKEILAIQERIKGRENEIESKMLEKLRSKLDIL